MKFKEIKPGMVIHCQTEEDARVLLEQLAYLSYGIPSDLVDGEDDICYFVGGIGQNYAITSNTAEAYYRAGYKITEFSDLIEPDNDRQYGNWIQKIDSHGQFVGYKCGCGYISQNHSRYCPNCGKNMYDDSPINSPTDSPMTAEELLKRLREIESEGKAADVFGCYFESILDFQTDEEILEGIAKYEAEKKPKPVEKEIGHMCVIYDEFHNVAAKRELWLTTEREAKSFAQGWLSDYTEERRGIYTVAVEYMERQKEGEA